MFAALAFLINSTPLDVPAVLDLSQPQAILETRWGKPSDVVPTGAGWRGPTKQLPVFTAVRKFQVATAPAPWIRKQLRVWADPSVEEDGLSHVFAEFEGERLISIQLKTPTQLEGSPMGLSKLESQWGLVPPAGAKTHRWKLTGNGSQWSYRGQEVARQGPSLTFQRLPDNLSSGEASCEVTLEGDGTLGEILYSLPDATDPISSLAKVGLTKEQFKKTGRADDSARFEHGPGGWSASWQRLAASGGSLGKDRRCRLSLTPSR